MTEPDPSNWRAYVAPAAAVLLILAFVAAAILLVVHTS